MALTEPLISRLTRWLRSTPSFWILVVGVILFLLARYVGIDYLARTEWVTEPLYNPRVQELGFLGDTLAAIPGYTYALTTRAVPLPAHIMAWPTVAYGAIMLTLFSLMLACVSFLGTTTLPDRIRFWVVLAIAVVLSTFLISDAVTGSPMQAQILRFLIILLNAGGIYIFNQFSPRTSLGLRFATLAWGNLLWYGSLYFLGGGWATYTLWAGYSSVVPVLLACVFVFQVAYFLPYGSLLLAVRQNINGLFAFILILLLGAGNVLVAYLKAASIWQGSLLFTPDAFWVLVLLAVGGAEAYQTFVDEDSNWFTRSALAKPLYMAWGGLTFCFLAWGFATENGPLTEVVEDVTNLSVVGVSAGFLVYVAVNFGVPLARSQRVDRVLFSPYQLPFSGIMGIAATIMLVFFLSGNKFQYFQSRAGMFNAVADGYFQKLDLQSADLFYQESTGNDLLNFHANYMLAQLAQSKGAQSISEGYLKNACDIKARPESYLAMAEHYRNKGVFMLQALTLQEGHLRFPDDKRLTSNLLVTYLPTILSDSITLLASQLGTHPGLEAESNILAAGALGKLPASFPRPGTGPIANRYLGASPAPDPCSLLGTSVDTASLTSMASFLGVFNGLVLCEKPTLVYARLDSMLASVEGGFREDLLYGRAWALWRSGNRLQALEDIQTLADPASLSAATYYATAIAWAEEMGNHTLAKRLYQSAPAGLLSRAFDVEAKDSTLAAVPYAQVPEPKRAAWILQHPAAFSPQALAALMPDFKTAAQQRAALLAALRNATDRYAYLREGLPRLAPATSETAGLDRQLAYATAEAYTAAGQPIGQVPAKLTSLLGSGAQALEKVQSGKASRADLEACVRSFPFSPAILARCQKVTEADPSLLQPFFEAVTTAYALDHDFAPTRSLYVALARRLNLDSFADAAEGKETP